MPLRDRDAGFTAFGPVVDGDLVTGPPWEAIQGGAGRDVDLICGFTHEEYRGQGPPPPPGVDLAIVAEAIGLNREAVDAYRQAHPGIVEADLFTVMLSDALIRMPTTWVAQAHARAGGRTWLYDVAWRSPGLGAGHGVDVPLVFGTGGTRYAARFLGASPPAGFESLSERIRRAWTGFAAAGDPGWPRFDHALQTRIWDTSPRDVEDPLADSRRIWETMAAGAVTASGRPDPDRSDDPVAGSQPPTR